MYAPPLSIRQPSSASCRLVLWWGLAALMGRHPSGCLSVTALTGRRPGVYLSSRRGRLSSRYSISARGGGGGGTRGSVYLPKVGPCRACQASPWSRRRCRRSDVQLGMHCCLAVWLSRHVLCTVVRPCRFGTVCCLVGLGFAPTSPFGCANLACQSLLKRGSYVWLPITDQVSYFACQVGPTVSYWFH
jgi:hypothetical protein